MNFFVTLFLTCFFNPTFLPAFFPAGKMSMSLFVFIDLPVLVPLIDLLFFLQERFREFPRACIATLPFVKLVLDPCAFPFF